MNEILSSISSYLGPIAIVIAEVAVAIIAFTGLAAFKTWLKSKNISIDDSETMYHVETTIANVVRYLNQTLVDKWKENNADSKLTEEQIAEVQSKALELIKSLLTEEQLATLWKQYGDPDTALPILIENSVLIEKANKA